MGHIDQSFNRFQFYLLPKRPCSALPCMPHTQIMLLMSLALCKTDHTVTSFPHIQRPIELPANLRARAFSLHIKSR